MSYFEDRTFAVIGIRDSPKSKFGAFGVRGQMDCIDELTNTRALLLYLEDLNLLRHHTVTRNASRGMLIDGRYFHNTAVVRDFKRGQVGGRFLVRSNGQHSRYLTLERLDGSRLLVPFVTTVATRVGLGLEGS